MSKDTKTDRSIHPSDIKMKGWVFRLTPKRIWPYLTLARVDRPIGTWLLLLPCWWGLAAAGGENATLLVYYAFLFAVGAFVMRGAGCIWNDILDRDYDAKVARTALRPIASGEISVPSAALLLAALTGIGLLVLVQFNDFTILTATISLVLVALYPMMKRITYWPQAWLGLTFNWGVLVGCSAINGALDASAYCLYAAGFLWTLGYDTIYALQDKDDDALIGVRSTALLFGQHTPYWVAVFYSASLIMFAVAGLQADMNTLYYVGVGIATIQFGWQVLRLDIKDPQNCLAKFKSNKWLGILIAISLVAGRTC
tara:strand:- start:5474 stop:6409 length:936 start_codon:yes stop_codon:yes gene_type:complete